MKRFVLLIVLAGGFIGCMVYGLINEYVLQEEPDWDQIGVENVGTVYKISPGSGGGAFIWHIVDGKKYQAFDGTRFYGMVIGDKFKILYDPLNPEKFKTKSWEPVFLEDEETIEVTGEITKVNDHTWWSKGKILFTYQVDGKFFKRGQHLAPNYKEYYPNLKEGNKYLVRYWVKNPQRAIIYLDKPQGK